MYMHSVIDIETRVDDCVNVYTWCIHARTKWIEVSVRTQLSFLSVCLSVCLCLSVSLSLSLSRMLVLSFSRALSLCEPTACSFPRYFVCFQLVDSLRVWSYVKLTLMV